MAASRRYYKVAAGNLSIVTVAVTSSLSEGQGFIGNFARHDFTPKARLGRNPDRRDATHPGCRSEFSAEKC